MSASEWAGAETLYETGQREITGLELAFRTRGGRTSQGPEPAASRG